MNFLFSNIFNVEMFLYTCRFTLKKEKEKRRNANILCQKIREELKRKEKQYSNEVEEKGQLELTLRAQEMELKIVRSNLNQVDESFVQADISHCIYCYLHWPLI